MHARRGADAQFRTRLRTSFSNFARAPILNINAVSLASTHYTRLMVPPIVPVNRSEPGPHACDETSRPDGP
jgi:hypothetical protein